VSLTAELWDAVGPLVSTQIEAKDGKPPIEISFKPLLERLLNPLAPELPTRTFRLAMLIRSEVVFVYHEVPCPTTTVPPQALDWLRSLGGRRA